MSRIADKLPESCVKDRLIEIAGAKNLTIQGVARIFGSSGYVVESVPLALFSAQQVKTLGFVQMLESIVGAGGDTDTNASIAGQVAGCFLGINELPGQWIDQIPECCEITETARNILRFGSSEWERWRD